MKEGREGRMEEERNKEKERKYFFLLTLHN